MQPSNPLIRTQYTNKELPKMGGFTCTVLAGAFHRDVETMFTASGFTLEDDFTKADLVVFTGGSDVHPSLYGEKPIDGCYFNERRDEYEKGIYEKCLELEKPMFGICRGLQFLHVMNGGKLYQDVNNHAGGNHGILDLDNNQTIQGASSIHHQMCIHTEDEAVGMELTAVASWSKSTYYRTYNERLSPAVGKYSKWHNGQQEISISGSVLEVEAAYYPRTLCFGVQGHPEICHGEIYQAWTMEYVNDFLCGNVNGVEKTVPQLVV